MVGKDNEVRGGFETYLSLEIFICMIIFSKVLCFERCNIFSTRLSSLFVFLHTLVLEFSLVLFARIKGIKRHEVEDHEERQRQGKHEIARSSGRSITPVYLLCLSVCAVANKTSVP